MMNCFEFRRRVLADPRDRTVEQEQHAATCEPCAALARQMDSLETRIQEAVLVPVPEGLADRVLLRQGIEPALNWRAWALAASLVAALGTGIYFYRASDGERVLTAAVLGVKHPAVAAIAHVLDEEPQMLRENRGVDPVMMRAAFTRRGLRVPANGTTVRYFDKCPLTGGAGEHVVLQTPFGQVTVILMPEQSLGPRVIVADRQMTALANPARSGGYILVADSLDRVKRIEKMLL